MMPGKGKLPAVSAALAGIPAGIQTLGPWSGRRQLFVRFAGEAETATIYTADALRGELTRLQSRSKYHSIAVVGRDALAEEDFLRSAFPGKGTLPVMIDHDGQRPDKLAELASAFSLVQITLDGTETQRALECACETLSVASAKSLNHALVFTPAHTTGDGPLLRIVEQAHQASEATQIVVHPVLDPASDDDRRWGQWLERAMAVHGDVRIQPRWPVVAPR